MTVIRPTIPPFNRRIVTMLLCAAGMAFGSGMNGQTTPETDNGNLAGWASALKSAGGQPLCP